MTILIIDNYRNGNPEKIAQIKKALAQAGKMDVMVLSYSALPDEQVPDDTEAIILSGSEAHLSDSTECPKYEAETRLIRNTQLPVLGICFGHQLIGKAFGSNLKKGQLIRRIEKVEIVEPDTILSSLEAKKNLRLEENHEDCLEALPMGFVLLARSDSCPIEAMKHKEKPTYGIQAHIERATEDNPDGRQIIRNFIENVVERCAVSRIVETNSFKEIKQGIIDSLRDISYDVIREDYQTIKSKLKKAQRYVQAWALKKVIGAL